MKSKIKSLILCLGLLLGSLSSAVFLTIKTSATQQGEGEYGLTVSVDSNSDWVTSLTVNNNDWSAEDEYLTESGNYFLTIELQIPEGQVKDITSVRTSGDVADRFEIRSAGNPEVLQNGKKKFTFTANYEMSAIHEHLSLNPFSEENHNGGEPAAGNLLAHLLVACDETGEARCLDTSFSLNNGSPEPYRGENEDIEYYYNGGESDEQVTLRVETLWHQKITHLLVNDEEVVISNYIDYADQKSYLDHYERQITYLELTVPKAANNTYNIALGVAINETKHIGNFLWTADPAQKDKEDYIGNSSLALVAVSYTLDDIIYSCNADTGLCSQANAKTGVELLGCNMAEDSSCGIPHVEFDLREDADFDDGALVVPAGARVTMRVIPDYGYQVLNVNMSELETNDDGVGEFTFTVPAGAAYFVADVVKLDDEVNTTSEKVASGSIELGENQTTLTHGTARLDVADVELTEENKEKFAEIAEEDGYKIKNYLDISLYNITYKGTEEEAWVEQYRELNEPATITLKLEEGVDGNDVVIVHEKHDGTYEVIETTYDPETNTISFQTSSFSNYAIASRTVSTPGTGLFSRESSGVKATCFGIVLLGGFLSFLFVARQKISR
ncbi:hypothetical protein IJI70_01805 [Candidatus Saccharibacteria bacterium]|nr:hypothetical protein [Candidatus Saccharibacteria bacterium]